ncbi:MAG TPA: DUF2663 family protein [Bacillales bacterium]|nr:DUF2663 family protein [Bacillales bacterium]
MDEITAEQFGKRISEVTLRVLNELVERKLEEKQCKSAVTRAGLFLMMVFVAFLLYIWSARERLFDGFSLAAFSAAFSDPFLWILAAALLFGFFHLQHVSKKYEDADEDFEELRCELVDRSEELWSDPEQWKNRHHVFLYLEKEYRINLFHK